MNKTAFHKPLTIFPPNIHGRYREQLTYFRSTALLKRVKKYRCELIALPYILLGGARAMVLTKIMPDLVLQSTRKEIPPTLGLLRSFEMLAVYNELT